MSCATHRLDGGMPVTVTIFAADGQPLTTLDGEEPKD